MDTLRLPFDQYQRYRLVADLVEELRPSGRRLRILDVGGRTALLREFLPDDRVDLVDVDPSEVPGLVLGSGAALPFADGSFDVVAAFDTLEHVPPGLREAFVTECHRVARRHVVLAGPYAAPEVDEAEELLVGFLRDKLGVEHRYLAEHRTNGLPDREQVEGWLRAAGGKVASVGHASLERWLPLMCLELYLDHDPMLRELAGRFFAFYNASMYASDHAAPVYRHAVVAAKGRARLPRTEGLFGPARAPEGAVPSLLELGMEVVRFDAERDALRPELERLAAVVKGLEEDLAGHRARLRDTEADLMEHGATLRAERAERAQEQEATGAVLHEVRQQLGETRELAHHLEEQLKEHQGLAAVQAEELEGFRGQDQVLRERVADQDAAIETLTADLTGHRESLEAVREELEAREEDLRSSGAQLESARAEAEALTHARDEALARLEAAKVDLEGHRETAVELTESLLEPPA